MNSIAKNKTIYLASRSPRRAEILQQLKLPFIVLPSDIDESALPNEMPADYVLRLARAKATRCLLDIQSRKLKNFPILAADTTVAIDGLILGKPVDNADAIEMLKRMSGRWHEVHTAIAVANADGMKVALSTTRVHMAMLSDATIAAYIATGEPKDKAGAYGIQGVAGSFIRHIDGSYSGVMGLPIYETTQLLAQVGIGVL